MKSVGNLKLLMIALAIAAAIAAASFILGGALNACADQKLVEAMKIGEANGCFEFWANRYQSLAGNVLTAIVAGITLLWVARQLVAANQQTAIASSVALRTVVQEFEQHRKALIEIQNRAAERPWPFGMPAMETLPQIRSHAERVAEALQNLRGAATQFLLVANKNRSPIVMNAATAAHEGVKRMAAALNRLNGVVAKYDEPDLDLQIELAVALLADARNEIRSFQAELERAKARIRDEIDAAWTKIRDLEYAAIGPWWRRG